MPKNFRNVSKENAVAIGNPDANYQLPETVTSTTIEMIETLLGTGPKDLYLKEQYLSKFVSSDTDPASLRRSRALEKWLGTEVKNANTNLRLLNLEGEYNILPRITWDRFRSHCRKLILSLLGETVPLEALFGGFSGGASTSKSRASSHPAAKYLGKADVTSAAKGWFDLVMDESPLWGNLVPDLDINIVKGNHYFTVPKSTLIDRSAAMEPDLNMYLQKGAGNYIRRALRKKGINLNDQTRNQKLARIGSIDNSLATIDLSSASDSVSIEIVAQLLPDMWYCFLSNIRSPFTLIDEEWHENEMFSSMGNGFTFELQSLLFWAAARTTRDLLGYSGVVSVYGDDIIIESAYAQDFYWVLGVLGFSVNEDKSFTSGPFRESCGGHYHHGNDITPFFIRRPITKVRDAILVANRIRAWSVWHPEGGVMDPTLYPVWKYLEGFISDDLKGGIDLNVDNQLVSYLHYPCKRLVASAKKRKTGTGGYLLWLDACGTRESATDGIQTSEAVTASGIYRKRRVRADGRKPDSYFYQEVLEG